MKRLAIVSLSIAALTLSLSAGQSKSDKPLEIYVVDTEGGKAVLFVPPSGESVLIDSGNPGGRDTDRIMLAVADAGLKRIDHLISTHYHVDHVGGMPELAKRIPIAHYIDHGPTVEPPEQPPGFHAAYAELRAKVRHTVVKPGDRVPVAGLDWRIVTAGGSALKTPLAGAGRPNPACAGFTPKEISGGPENAQSVGSVIGYGQFRMIDLGDLLWNNEFDLMCPTDKVGPVDLYVVSHHGLDSSGSAALVHGLRPRVALMQNGPLKGGTMPAYRILRASPGLEDLWQLHWSHRGAIEHNSAGVFIANVDEPAAIAGVLTTPPGPGGGGGGVATAGHTPAYWIKVSAQTDGSFVVANSRNNFSKTYARRAP